jgi:single-strand DNA-binding protein
MHKGRGVAVDGRLEWREWEATDRSSENGQHKRQAVSVVAETVQFLDRPAGERGASEPQGRQDAQDGERELVGAGVGEVDLVF